MNLAALSCAIIALLGAPPACAAIAAPGRYQKWSEGSRAPIPTATTSVQEVHDEASRDDACGDPMAFGCTLFERDGYTIVIFDLDADLDRLVFLHELGHVFDFGQLDERQRRRFSALVGRYSMPWFDDGLMEQFADAYSQCAQLGIVRYDRKRRIIGDFYAYRVTTYQHNRICRFIEAAARTPGAIE